MILDRLPFKITENKKNNKNQKQMYLGLQIIKHCQYKNNYQTNCQLEQ